MSKALSGMKILDFTQLEAASSGTEILAWLGADVIKVEGPGRPELGRFAMSTADEIENGIDSWYYISLNANKRSITLDLKSPKGLALAKEFVRKVDVVASNFAPGVMDALGLGYDVLTKINPKIIYAVNSGFGLTGRYSSYLVIDTVAKAVSSATSNTGFADRPPISPGPTIGDTGAGMNMVSAILAAYIAVLKTGKGQIVDQSMSDVCMALNRVPMALAGSFTGTPAKRVAASDAVKCKGDGPNDYFDVWLTSPAQVAKLLKAIGREGCFTVSTSLAVQEKMPEIRKLLQEWTQTKTKMEAFDILAPLGIPCAPVLDTVEALNNPHFIERGMSIEMTHPKRGKFRMPGCPIRLSDSPIDYKIAPAMGQDNCEVYMEYLNFSKEDVEELKAEKVI